MKAQPDCVVCSYQQALNTARIATRNPALHAAVLRTLAERMRTASLDQTPAALSQAVYEVVAEVTGKRDPYARVRRETNAAALALLPSLEKLVHSAHDPLKAACRLAVAGNIIDLGIGHRFDLKKDVHAIMRNEFSIDDYAAFKRELRPGKRLLYLGDNSGEIVFDRVLVEHLLAARVDVTFVVKSGPIINDALMADARFCGLTRLVPVITTGSNDIGINWQRVSVEFRDAFAKSDIVLAKGHGNTETCMGHPGNLYFLLKAKCRIVADAFGVKVGALIFAHPRKRA
jgi:damage-control phosphatase, subfamily I